MRCHFYGVLLMKQTIDYRNTLPTKIQCKYFHERAAAALNEQ